MQIFYLIDIKSYIAILLFWYN